MGYLSEESLNKLVNDPGKYQMDDTSVIAHKLDKLWTFTASHVPDWISANVVTVGAAVPLILAWIVSMFYSATPGNVGLPWWLLVFAAFAEFFFQTMDAVDGKHARRLGTSSSLGDFLDHVMDSVSIMTTSFVICQGLGFNSPAFEFMCLVDASLSFVVVHWESAKILVMKLDNGSSITEAQLSFVLIFLITAFAGVDLWQIAPIPVFPYITLGRIVAGGMMGAITAAQCYKSISRVVAKCDWRVVLPELFIPVIGGAAVAVAWLLVLPTNQSVAPFQVVLLASTVIHSCSITLNRLTLQPIVPQTTLVVLVPSLLLPLIVPASLRVTASWVAAAWSGLYVLYFLCDIIFTIARTLKLPIFAQPPLKKKD